ncbi:MAG: hypothetical protein Q9171_004594 [Xanthocarpia ochracea]
MESKLGYKVDASNYPYESVKRFYLNLRLIPDGIHIVYGFIADIHYDFGMDLPLLLTEDEVIQIMSVARLQRSPRSSHVSSFFSKLPRELRDRIYSFVLPRQSWSMGEHIFTVPELFLVESIGDLSVFYFPLSTPSISATDLGILSVSQQMREEALPLALRRTSFQLDDIDDLIKLLLNIGQTGRENIESLEFGWYSTAEMGPSLTLPAIHVETCLQLLKQCARLKDLQLHFEKDLIDIISPDAFKANVGIQGLSSIRGLRSVEIRSLENHPLEQEGVVRWLKEQLESPVL